MGRLNTMTDQNNATLVSGVTYGAANQVLSIAGTLSETRTYNTNLQLTELVSGSFYYKYNYSATQNNGRILSMNDVVSGETVTYQYDTLNRLINASGTGDPQGGWSQAFTYDGFGNLTQKTSSNAPALSVAIDPATNRLTTNGAGYDANGNLTAYGTGGFAAVYVYDIENRLNSATVLGTTYGYSYDSLNERVFSGTLSGSTYTNQQIYFYGPDGKKLGIWSYTGSAIQNVSINQWFAGRQLKAEDRLQSVGKYFPYGEDRYSPNPPNPANDQEKFATYSRDSSTGLDYAKNRYYNSSVGRFMTTDPYAGSANPSAPQTLNRYSYVASDPVNYDDPSGLDLIGVGTCSIGAGEGHTQTVPCFLYSFSYPAMQTVKGYDDTHQPSDDPRLIIKNAERAAAERLFDPDCAGLFLAPGANTLANRKNLSRELDKVQDNGLIRAIQAPRGSPPELAGVTTAANGSIYFYSGRTFFTVR